MVTLLEELRTGILTKPERSARHLQRPVGLPRALHMLLQAEALLRVQQTTAAVRSASEAIAVARRPDVDGRVDETVLLMACAVRADLACLQTAPEALATALEFFSVARRSTDELWYYPAASLRAVVLFHRGAQEIGGTSSSVSSAGIRKRGTRVTCTAVQLAVLRLSRLQPQRLCR